MYHTIKQLEERNVANEIEILLWSDRMDLVAFANVKGEVALHRLTWARAWSLGPAKDGITVKGLAWRPDGKVLAIAYSTGEILLVNVENRNTLNKIVIEGNISCISWIREKTEPKSKVSSLLSDQEEQNDYMKYLDYSSIYLPDLAPLSTLGPTNSQEETNSNLFLDQPELNLLIVGTTDGYLHISIFGHFPCAFLNLSNYLGYQCSILNVHLTDNLCLMFVTIKDNDNSIKVVTISTDIFNTHTKELFAVALKYGQLNNLVTYLSNAIGTIKETWETILLEMDAKLTKYASKVPPGKLTADFLDLLMFGITSEEMQEFLLQDLTEKGLKKFGQIIEMSYANIQKLLLKNITKVGQNITFHLAELRGMARLEYRYKALGLAEDIITLAVNANGAFLVKSGEMQQIINNSMINNKAFFRWLYTAIIHLMDEQIPPEMPKMTLQDVAHITEFVQHFDKIGSKKDNQTIGFTMEPLGQYLEDSPLTLPQHTEDNIWEKFLDQNDCVSNHPSIINRNQKFSLVQQFKHLSQSVEDIFTQPKSLIAEQFCIKKVLNCLQFSNQSLRLAITNYNNESSFVAFLDQKSLADGMYFIEINYKNDNISAKCAYFYFSPTQHGTERSAPNYNVLDVKFYSVNILSVLLQENSAGRTGCLYQFPANIAREKLVDVDLNTDISTQNLPKVNGLNLTVSVLRNIDGMVCDQFAVSGCRRVSVVLSENKRKVRLFEMEGEEEDEDEGDADMTNSAKESDTSMQDESSVME